MCPKCQNNTQIAKFGFYRRPSDNRKLQRYRCLGCRKTFSEQITTANYRLRKRSINQQVFRLLSRGISQRACALLLGVKKEAIATRLIRFGRVARKNLEIWRKDQLFEDIMFDEMESFEHTKCKPLTMGIAVSGRTRLILGIKVGAIAAKGPLAAISRKKYGPRRCQRQEVLKEIFTQLKTWNPNVKEIKTDESPYYSPIIKFFCPQAKHIAFKGRRGCVVGQGELKRGGFDPLFFLNHTYAMIRDNIKRLTRRTWCTTKKINNLEWHLYIYAWFHNLMLSGERRPTLKNLQSINI